VEVTAVPPATGERLTVSAAVELELAEMAKRAPGVTDSVLAATARVLADELDSHANSATSKSLCAKAMYEALDRLADLVPPAAEENDPVDRLLAAVGGAAA
jgi:hypothetical protein